MGSSLFTFSMMASHFSLGFVLMELGNEVQLCLRESRSLGNTVLVLAREDTLLKGRENGKAKTGLAVQVCILSLNLLALQHVVGWLLHERTNEVQLVCVSPGLGNFIGVPFGGTPVQSLALIDDVVKGTDGLFNGSTAVGPVRVNKVDILEPKTLQ